MAKSLPHYLKSPNSNAHERMVLILQLIGDSEEPIKMSNLIPFLCEEFPKLTEINARMSIVRLKKDGLIVTQPNQRDSLLFLTNLGREFYYEDCFKRDGEMETESFVVNSVDA